jgi:ABC-type nitrate/sulfonate/bicarbonate transport system substrate-binding protein
MKRSHRRLGLGPCALRWASAAAFLLAACGQQAAPAATSTPAQLASSIPALASQLRGQHLVLGLSSSPNAAKVGAFRTAQYLRDDYGLRVDVRPLEPNSLVAALNAGQVDVGALSLAGIANADAQGAHLVGFATDQDANTYVIAARPPIDAVGDIRGKALAVTANLAQAPGQTARACFQRAGLNLDRDARLVHLADTDATMRALDSGQVPAALTSIDKLPPYEQRQPNAFNVICRGSEILPMLSSVWMGTADWMRKHPDLALAIAVSSIKTGRWTHADGAGWVRLMRDTVKGTSQAVAEREYQILVQQLDTWPANGGLSEQLCAKTLDDSYRSGAIPKPYRCSDLVSMAYQAQALKILGPAR